MSRHIIDCHAHSGPYFNFFVPRVSAEDMLAGMDNVGINISCITPNMGLLNDITKGNQEMLRIISEYRNRFKGYICINPNYPEHIKEDLDRYISNENVIGVKIHHTCHNTSIKNPSYDYAYSYINEKKGVILFHTWDMETISEIERVSKKYLDASIIMGHFGAYPDNMRYIASLINDSEHLYGDNCLSITREGNVEWLVSLVGSQKLLFGTDLPFFDPRPSIGRIINAILSENDKDQILGLNMERIMKRIEK
ncbi:MAG: amidohydrolase family protein [Clostridia bacterium]|nr:amidohydrolase family protein [Clostridia bacterium]